jgi:phosphatidylserine/phosphatidylglycerophosphate/cardiolipin synthase-like enzyme
MFFSIILLFFPFGPWQETPAKATEVYFSPQDHLADKLVSYIDQEQKTIRVAAYAFSHWKIAKALCQAKERGVDVEVIVDPFTLQFPSALKKMAKSQIPIWIWDPKPIEHKNGKKKMPLMHDKFCVFEEHAVWTGSFNFTYTADSSNCENALILHNPDIAQKFKAQFQHLKESGCKAYTLAK